MIVFFRVSDRVFLQTLNNSHFFHQKTHLLFIRVSLVDPCLQFLLSSLAYCMKKIKLSPISYILSLPHPVELSVPLKMKIAVWVIYQRQG